MMLPLLELQEEGREIVNGTKYGTSKSSTKLKCLYGD
jgi:hypothetical protein